MSLFLFTIALLALIVGLLAVLFGKGTDPEPMTDAQKARYERTGIEPDLKPGRPSVRPLGALAMAIGVALAAAACVTTVPAQSVGVVTSFGKPTGTVLDPGLHGKLPWHKVSDMDGTVQPLNNLGATATDGDDVARARGRTTVRLNNNSLMYVENALRWKIKPAAAPGLFLDWRKGDKDIVANHIADGLVAQELAGAINVALSTYDPLTPGAAGQTTDELATKVTDRLNSRLGTKVEVVSFNILRVDFDDATQARVINFQEEVARTKAAEQRKLTAEADADANRKLASSVSRDPNVLVARCLTGHDRIIEKGGNLQGVPSCWPYGQTPSLVKQAQ